MHTFVHVQPGHGPFDVVILVAATCHAIDAGGANIGWIFRYISGLLKSATICVRPLKQVGPSSHSYCCMDSGIAFVEEVGSWTLLPSA